MPATTRNLTIMLLPQSWDGANLIANILLLPNGDPTVPTGPELPFASARPVLRAAVLSGLDTPPWAPATTPEFVPFTLHYSAAQAGIFSALVAEYNPAVPALTQPTAVIRKDLPDSYREATGFQTPDATFFTAEDGFGCALAAATPSQAPLTPQPIAWGEVLSYALRQPLVAQAMGLMYLSVSIPLTSDQVSGGGWIWIEIDPSDPANWYAGLVGGNPAAVVSYAARLPVLTTAQDVFAALLFPTVPSTVDSATVDAAQYEADIYLDGFAKIVHAAQPTSSDAVTNDPTHIVPGTDAGVQIGWDDEQVTTWVNRQIAIAQAFATGAAPLAELPFTVLGYRVDVRETPPAPNPPGPWSSLCLASGTINAANAFTTNFTASELCVEPTPIQNGTPGLNADYWLPQYFAQWRGRTLVANDKYAYAFSGGQPPTASFPPATSDFNGTTTEVLSGVDLRYGNSYQFRTRLTDLTGGGPKRTDDSPADAGITNVDFRRNVPPKKVQLTVGGFDASGNQSLTVDRPLINYPEMVFSGAAGSGADEQATLDALLAITPPQQPFGNPLDPKAAPFQAALLDPDVTTLEIIVEAQAPAHDTGNPCSLADADTPPAHLDLDGTFRVVYKAQIPFPKHHGPFEVGASTPIQLVLKPTPMKSIAHPPLIPLHSTTLPIPTGRNVRIRMRGLGNSDPNGIYFASSIARTGLITDFTVRYEADIETDVLVSGNIDQQLQAFYLRNLDNTNLQKVVATGLNQVSDFGFTSAIGNLLQTVAPTPSTPSQLLSNALQLPLNGLTFSAPPGKRVLFGAQSTLRHNITQDRSQITFSAEKDLINHWIVVHRFTLDRDWTWSGLAQNGPGQIAFTMGAELPDSGPVTVGRIDLPGVVSSLATQSNGDPNQRDSTELIFFSTLDSTVPPDEFPAPTTGGYQLSATFTGDPTNPATLWVGSITVPITAQPRQVPQIVSAGIAESPYIAAADYSSTTQRQRALWFEFDVPPQDPNDAYFVRVVNYGVDPLLVSHPRDFHTFPDSPIPLDPEPIRTITPDSGNDDAGLSAMTQLVPSSSSPFIHFLIPLPDGISPSALDLFGFWTYEIRCGHLLRSTAQGRFGRPFRVAGVQHPCPPLTLTVDRSNAPGEPAMINASANLAQTVLDGRSLTSPYAPQTQIWFALYAQLRRADGEAYRNLLIDTAQGFLQRVNLLNPVAGPLGAITVTASFLESDVADILASLLLPPNTPLSILAVEFFNLESEVVDFQYGEAGGGSVLAAQDQRSLRSPAASSLQSQESSAVATAGDADDTQASNPLGPQLGSQRILRTSPLVPVRATC